MPWGLQIPKLFPAAFAMQLNYSFLLNFEIIYIINNKQKDYEYNNYYNISY